MISWGGGTRGDWACMLKKALATVIDAACTVLVTALYL